MQAPAIDDHLSTKLCAWYTFVSVWEPPGEGSTEVCQECIESALGCTIDLLQWPHDVIHVLVVSLRSAVRDVHASYCEEFEWDRSSAPIVARDAVRDALAAHAEDIIDVLEHCVSDKVDTWVTAELADDQWDVSRRAAS